MSGNTSSTPNPWSILKWLAIMVSPPLATVLPSVQQLIPKNHWLVVALIIIYELVLLVIYLLSKVWGQLEGKWITQIADALDQYTHIAISHYERHYRRYFFYEHQDIDVKGMSTQGAYTLDLEHIFVDLRIDPKPSHQVTTNPISAQFPAELQTGKHSLWEYLQAPLTHSHHLVLLGAPGSGKTTLVKYLSLMLVQRKYPPNIGKFPHHLPLLLFLREHSKVIAEQPDYSLAEAVRVQVRLWSRPMPAGWIEQRLAAGHCLVLLDGLDEVADPAHRLKVVQWVDRQMVAYGGNRFVVTSRPYGYRSNPLSSVNTLEVQPFTLEQITQFVNNWYIAIEVKSAMRDDPGVRLRAQREAEDLIKRLIEKEALIELAVNPLLLTMIATVHRYRGSLPGARITLYKEICEVLLGTRQEARGIPQDLRIDQRQLVLQSLAYQMMRKGKREIMTTKAKEIIASALPLVSTAITPAEFLKSIENSSGLLLEKEEGWYAFAHLTFQEYLTAMYIRENSLEQELIGQVEQSWWHETIRLYCAQSDATAVVAACFTKAASSIEALTLGLECLEEARNVRTEVKQQLQGVIQHGIEDGDLQRRQIIAEALLSQRLRAMHPLNERVSIDTSLVTCAEYQLFLNDQQLQGKYYQPVHWTNVSFPAGSAQVAVSGVSQSDARAFCRWLTQRGTSIWQYRLPRPEEWNQGRSLWRERSNEIGFWADSLSQLIWSTGSAPVSLQKQLQYTRSIGLNIGEVPKLADLVTLVRVLKNDLVTASEIIDSRVFTDLDTTFAGSLARAYALNDVFSHALALANALESDIYALHAHSNKNALLDALNRASALGSEITKADNLDAQRIRSYINQEIADQNNARMDARARIRANASTLYSVLFLLRQRNVGVFSAYEGILLVKERKS